MFNFGGGDFGSCFCFPIEWAEAETAVCKSTRGNRDPDPNGNGWILGLLSRLGDGMRLLMQRAVPGLGASSLPPES